MKKKELKYILSKLPELTEKDFQTIEWEMEKLRKLRMIMTANQPQLPLFGNFEKSKLIN